MGTTLTLERYAELRAEMESACPRDDVLARAGLTTAEWTEAQREWLDKMGNELARSQFELTNRYAQAFLDRQRALRAIASPRAAAPSSAPAAVPAAAPDPPMNPSSIVAQPAALAPDRFPSRSSPDLSAEAVAAMMAVPDDMPGSSTLPLPSQQHRTTAAAPLPFRAGAPGAPPAPHAAIPSPASEDLRADATLVPALFEEASRAAKSPLPFQPSAAQPETRMSGAPPPAPPTGSISLGETADITSFVQRLREERRSVLPFEAASSTLREGNAKEPGRSSVSAPVGPLDVTGDISAAVQPARSSPLPFRESQPSPLPKPVSPGGGACRLTLEQFASLSAEMAVEPKAAPQVRARYGLDEALYMAEMAAWQRRFSADQELFKRYAGLYQSYREWLAKTKR